MPVTGLIYVILISLWGVVLVPRWLRHHDESRRRREAQRLERALNPHHVAAPAGAEADDSERYQSWGEYLRSLTRLDQSRWESVRWLEALRAPRGRHARRRRTIVVALAGLSGAGILGAVLGVVPGFLAVLSALALGAYVTLMYWQLRQWESRRSHASARAAAPAWGSSVTTRVGDSGSATVRDGVRVMSSAAAGDQWEPKQTPMPQYTAKSKATKIPRRIDLTERGWTGADMVEQARAQQNPHLQQQFDREFAALEPEYADEVDAYANPDDGYYRRAAGE